jgi:fucose permease
VLFASACFLLAAGEQFVVFAILLGLSGVAIGVFKTGALALIGDISTSTAQHTAIMNMAEGFFGIGAIVGPAILTRLLNAGCLAAALPDRGGHVRRPHRAGHAREISGSASAGGGPTIQRNGAGAAKSVCAGVLGGAFLYVGVEAAIYVWMPTWFQGDTGNATTLAAYSISIFFLLRAAGRFLGAWLLRRVRWQAALALFSGAILMCFAISVAAGVEWAVYLLPLSGLFMSVIYPTLNSKGISCLPKSDHGAGAGVILFFTCVSAGRGATRDRGRW